MLTSCLQIYNLLKYYYLDRISINVNNDETNENSNNLQIEPPDYDQTRALTPSQDKPPSYEAIL